MRDIRHVLIIPGLAALLTSGIAIAQDSGSAPNLRDLERRIEEAKRQQAQQQEEAARKAKAEQRAKAEADRQAAAEKQAQEKTRRLQPAMVTIPAGSFRMGDLAGNGESDEKPVHEVRIAKAFALGKYEVTFEEYDAFAQATGRQKPDDSGWGRGNRPVINVSWDDATAYAEWLGSQTGKRYRLPSETEWEYAARAGTSTAYSWGDELVRGRANCSDCGSQWDGRQTAPVGSFKPNAFGLYDMHGNVWEWVEDCYSGSYDGAPADGSAKRSCGTQSRVNRGGSWINDPAGVRSANRYWVAPSDRYSGLGFRLAEDLP